MTELQRAQETAEAYRRAWRNCEKDNVRLQGELEDARRVIRGLERELQRKAPTVYHSRPGSDRFDPELSPSARGELRTGSQAEDEYQP